jgi:hypothetical protein
MSEFDTQEVQVHIKYQTQDGNLVTKNIPMYLDSDDALIK